MPRDDLSIDFVKNMPPTENLDPSMILDDWINRVSNLPEEIRFIQDEIAERDRQYNECIKIIEDRDARIQKFIKTNSSLEKNPREDSLRAAIHTNYLLAEKLSDEKIALVQKMQLIADKHIRQLDMQIKLLYDRGEPGFTDPDEVPSLLRPSAANHTAPSARSINPAAHPVATPLGPILNSATPSAARAANPQIRNAQAQQTHAASAPTTPAASMILNRQARESSAGPAAVKRPRINTSVGTAPSNSSALARHSSLGPGTPKAHTPASGVQRAGSAGPRASVKTTAAGPGRKAGTPTAGINRKKGTPAPGNKSNLSRVKRPSKNSPSSTADSELSEADTASGSEMSSRRGTPAARTTTHRDGPDGHPAHHNHPTTAAERKKARAAAHANGEDDDAMDVDDDEAGDDKKYCICQNVSFGDMVACDNDSCPYEWFHWSCVGLKSEPNGTWYCPVCSEKMKKGK